MKLLFLFITYSSDLDKYISSRRESLIPLNIRQKATDLNMELVVQNQLVDQSSFEVSHVCDFVKGKKNYEAVFCAIDNGLPKLDRRAFEGAFISYFENGIEHYNKPLSKMHTDLVDAFGNFLFLCAKLKSFGNLKPLLLPINMFSSSQLRDFFNELPYLVDRPLFKDKLEKLISGLKSVERPKANKHHRARYFVDENKKYFEFGTERHGSCDLGHPHTSVCGLNASFRLGFRFDNKRHFNVTNERAGGGEITFVGMSCHDHEEQTYKSHTHLNVFPNGFIRS